MQTIHLTEEQIDAYLLDLADRLKQMDGDAPAVYAMIGASGNHLGRRLLALLHPSDVPRVALPVAYDREKDVVTFPFDADVGSVVRAKRVLLLDGTIHSGCTMSRVQTEIQKYEPKDFSSYAVAVRRGAKIIPNHFGFLIGDHDRVLFPRKKFCNSRLYPLGTHRKLSEADLTKPMIRSGRKFIDENTWDYHWYEMQTGRGQHVYVYETQGIIKGFVSFRFSSEEASFCVDDVAVDETAKGQKVGSFLLRWAEHWARHANCQHVDLWAVENLVPWYERKGYKLEDSTPLAIYGTTFRRMSKKTLYNLPDEENHTMGL